MTDTQTLFWEQITMRFVLFCILSLSLLIFGSESFALDQETLSGKVAECIQAWSGGTEASITEYVCPSGNFAQKSNQAFTRETLCGNIYMQLSFQEIDRDVEKYMKELQDTRNPDMTSWNENIRLESAVWGDKYSAVCSTASFREYCAATTDFFPESTCRDRANAKTQAWTNMGYILAGKGIAKAYQNDKDTYVEKIKTKYDTILKKWNAYKRIVDIAISKFTAYIRNAVK